MDRSLHTGKIALIAFGGTRRRQVEYLLYTSDQLRSAIFQIIS